VTASVVYRSEFLATDPEVRVRFLAQPHFLKIVGLERGPLSLVSTTEELRERKSSGSCRKPRLRSYVICRTDYAKPLYSQILALTSPTRGGRSVGMVCSRTKAMELSFSLLLLVVVLELIF
jgi:hypothetical protein